MSTAAKPLLGMLRALDFAKQSQPFLVRPLDAVPQQRVQAVETGAYVSNPLREPSWHCRVTTAARACSDLGALLVEAARIGEELPTAETLIGDREAMEGKAEISHSRSASAPSGRAASQDSRSRANSSITSRRLGSGPSGAERVDSRLAAHRATPFAMTSRAERRECAFERTRLPGKFQAYSAPFSLAHQRQSNCAPAVSIAVTRLTSTLNDAAPATASRSRR